MPQTNATPPTGTTLVEAHEFTVGERDTPPVEDPKDALIRELKAEVAEAQQRLDDLVRDAHTYADFHNLCWEFDEFMTDHGLPARRAEYEVVVRMRNTGRIIVTASSEKEALEKAQEDPDGVEWDDEWDYYGTESAERA